MNRQRLGWALLLGVPLVALLFYLGGVPLLSLQHSHTVSLPNGSFITAGYKIHWTLAALAVIAAAGGILICWPRRRPPIVR